MLQKERKEKLIIDQKQNLGLENKKLSKKFKRNLKKPARIWLNNKDWIIENFEGKKDIEIKAEDISLD
jgi:hypothetical protein